MTDSTAGCSYSGHARDGASPARATRYRALAARANDACWRVATQSRAPSPRISNSRMLAPSSAPTSNSG